MSLADRRLLQLLPEGARAFDVLDDRPVRDQRLVARIRPFEIRDGDAPMLSALDRFHDIGPREGVDIAAALQLQLLDVDAVGYVDRQHERKIDGLGARREGG